MLVMAKLEFTSKDNRQLKQSKLQKLLQKTLNGVEDNFKYKCILNHMWQYRKVACFEF